MTSSISRLLRIKTILPTLGARYDAIAHKWHNNISRLGYICAYKELVNAATPFLNEQSEKSPLSVLDAGCGTGAFSLAVCETIHRNMSIDLLDFSHEMLKSTEQTLQHQPHTIKQICTGIENIDPSKKTYDLILCAHIIDHLSDPVATLKTLRAALNPGGIILLAISKPHWCTSLIQLKWQNKAYHPNAALQMLKQAGLHNVTLFPFKEGPPKFTSHGYIVRNPK